jgi:type I restriction enzyme M protein
MNDEEYKQQLEQKLWDVADILRGSMDANEYKNYILGFIFYKFLSEKIENFLNKELEEDELTFQEAYENDEYYHTILPEEAVENLGYFLEPQYLFKTIVNKAQLQEFILEDLEKALNKIGESAQGSESEDDFENLFEDVDLQSSKLGKTPEEKNEKISQILLKLSEIDFKLEDTKRDILGDAYEYLIGQFASSAGKKAGEFYTPQEVSKVLAKIVTLDKSKIKSAYDPTCGSGSLLLRISKEAKVADFYGQELNQTTYNLARMNMILHGIPFDDFEIKRGDSLEDPQFIDQQFDAIVANPPFSAKWSSSKKFQKDPRFAEYGKLPPKSKADYAFVLHMIYHLKDNGIMAVVLPHGVLFRGASEEKIRKHLLEEKNYIDAIIGLPSNIFYGTGIPTIIMVLKKCRTADDNILFIDASQEYEKIKKQNKLRPQDIDKIINTYKNREEIEKYSHKATLEEIRENDYNLNIPRYVDTFEEEEPVDLDEVVTKLETINKQMKEVDQEIEKYCKELGIKPPTF